MNFKSIVEYIDSPFYIFFKKITLVSQTVTPFETQIALGLDAKYFENVTGQIQELHLKKNN